MSPKGGLPDDHVTRYLVGQMSEQSLGRDNYIKRIPYASVGEAGQ